jgi:hypothetical protein
MHGGEMASKKEDKSLASLSICSFLENFGKRGMRVFPK